MANFEITDEDLVQVAEKVDVFLKTIIPDNNPQPQPKKDAESLLREIDSGYKAPSRQASLKKEIEESQVLFRYQHVEQLLDQAADLLDRGIKARSEWDDNRVKAFNLGLELLEFIKTDEVHREETRAGFYNLISWKSEYDLLTEQKVKETNQKAAAELQNIINSQYGSGDLDRKLNNAGLLAWASAVPAYYLYDPGNIARTNEFDYFKVRYRGGSPSEVKDLVEPVARKEAEVDFKSQLALLNVQLRGYENLSSASTEKIEQLRKKAQYDRLDADNRGFRSRRTEVARLLNSLKSKSALSPGGALNYIERLAAIKTRFQRDFDDALARLYTAAKGLKLIYGYEVPLPGSLEPLLPELSDLKFVPPNDPELKYFDDCVNWIRDAISFLIRFNQFEQNVVVPVSIRALTGEGAWEEGKKSGVWSGVKIPESKFKDESLDQRHVRMRGISAYVIESNQSRGLWEVTVTPPANSFCQHRRIDAPIPLNQADLPPVRLGRVQSRDAARDPDVGGGAGLYNASPFGEFLKVQVRPATRGELSNIDDIELDLYAAMVRE